MLFFSTNNDTKKFEFENFDAFMGMIISSKEIA